MREGLSSYLDARMRVGKGETVLKRISKGEVEQQLKAEIL